ncbi:MAG: N-acetyltransferase family protein [Pseudomonadota bacterium]
MPPTIRDAQRSDLAAIADIWNAVIRGSTTTFTTREKTAATLSDWLTERIRAGEAVLVAVEGGTVLGFACYFPFRGGPGYRFTKELSIYLRDDQQGKGLGRALMAALEARAAQNGIHSLWAGCSATNPGSVEFHRALGFQDIATLPEVGYKFDQWLDLILLMKPLPQTDTSPE